MLAFGDLIITVVLALTIVVPVSARFKRKHREDLLATVEQLQKELEVIRNDL